MITPAKIASEDVSGRRDGVIKAVSDVARSLSTRTENVVHAELSASLAVFSQDENGGGFVDSSTERPIANQRDNADREAAVHHLAVNAPRYNAELRSDVSWKLGSEGNLRALTQSFERVADVVRACCNERGGLYIDGKRWRSSDVLDFKSDADGYEWWLAIVGSDESLRIVVRFKGKPRPHIGRSYASCFGCGICGGLGHLELPENQPKAERVERKASDSNPYRDLRRQRATPSVTGRSLRRTQHIDCCRIKYCHPGSDYRIWGFEAKAA